MSLSVGPSRKNMMLKMMSCLVKLLRYNVLDRNMDRYKKWFSLPWSDYIIILYLIIFLHISFKFNYRMRNVRTNLKATPLSPSAPSGPERCVR